MSSGVDGRNPKGAPTEREEKDHRIHSPILHPAPARANLQPNPSASPKSPRQFIFPYNGSSPVLQAHTNSHHPLEALRRLQHPPPMSTSSCSLSSPTLPANSTAQRSPRTPTPQSSSQGQRTPQTPETPSSPQLGALSSPPPSSPMAMVGGGRGQHTGAPHPHGVIVGGSPISSPSLSPSVHNMNCVSPHQRSHHPSASPSSLSEGGSSAAAGGGLMGSNLSQRKKSSSSSPQSPLSGGSPKPGPNFPKYKLDEILEQFKNSGSSSTNNHHLLLPTNPTLLTNQSSSSNPHALSSKPSKRIRSVTPGSGPPGFELNAVGPSGLTLGPFLNHLQSHQSRLPHPPSFPASSLLSAAAKAQLANQITQGQGSSVSSNPVSLPSSLELLKEAQQQPSSKVTISTLHNSHPSSSTASIRPPHPSFASASSILFPPTHSLAQSRASSLPHLPPTAERSASHRKRQRRSPTVLPQRDTQLLANGLPKTPPGDASSATAINLSSSTSFPSSSHSSSTSAVQNQNAVMLENHHPPLPGLMPRLPAPRQIAQLSRPPRQTEALDFTTYLTPTPLGLDPPTQPLSALLHLLSVQNAQAAASASNAASAQPGSVSSEGGGHTNKPSPRLSPSSPSPHSNLKHRQTRSPCPNTNPLPLVQPPLSPAPSSQFRSVQSPSHPQSDKSSPLQRLSPPAVLPNSELLNSSSSLPQHSSRTPSDKHQSTENRLPTTDSAFPALLQEASQQGTVAGSIPTSVEMSHPQGTVSVATSSSPKPLDLSNHVLALLAASSTVPQGEGSTSDRITDVEMSSQENPTAGKDIFLLVFCISIKILYKFPNAYLTSMISRAC